MLFSVTTTTAFAEETITNMTYDEWLAEQENNNTDIEENDLEPVKVTTEENAAKAAGIRGEVTDIGWGNQIRSYVMQPYTMVKDHRTGVESGNVDAVMENSTDL